MVEVVLGTDMAMHFEKLGKLRNRVGTGNDEFWSFEAPEDRHLMMAACLHAADISNPAKPLMNCLVWTDRVLQEFFAQGDLEKELGLPVGMLNDRATQNIARGQIGFIS